MGQAPLKTLSSAVKRTNFHALLNREIANTFIVPKLKVVKTCVGKVSVLNMMVIKATTKHGNVLIETRGT